MSLVKDYIRFKKMHKRVLLEKNKSKKLEIISSFFSKEEVEIFEKNNNEQFSLTSWEKNVVKKIITECLKNKIKTRC